MLGRQTYTYDLPQGRVELCTPLVFPTFTKISELFEMVKPYTPTDPGKPRPGRLNPTVLGFWDGRKHCRCDIAFECIEREDGVLVVANYSQIIGSRWLALLPSPLFF